MGSISPRRSPLRPRAFVLVACALGAGCPAADRGAPRPATATASAASVAPSQASSAVASTSDPARVTGASCEAIFATPAGAAPLCDEHVMANGAELHWRSFATDEARDAVDQRYRTQATACGFGVISEPSRFDVADGSRRHLETYDASDAGYPQCAAKPTSAHRTVLVLSELTRAR